MYSVKEIYPTLQGEGAQTGRAAVFCRFSGCNLWSGRDDDRADAVCDFCDTDFVGTDGENGGRYESARQLAEACAKQRQDDNGRSTYVVLTGGEPMLQVDLELIRALHAAGFEIGIETNGTLAVPGEIDWICVSPKAGAELRQTQGDELKLVFPQAGAAPEAFEGLAFDHFFLQPLDGPARAENTTAAADYCRRHPRWRLSLQTHKLIGLP